MPKKAKKYVYLFQEGNKDMREILGGKGANLAEMAILMFQMVLRFQQKHVLLTMKMVKPLIKKLKSKSLIL